MKGRLAAGLLLAAVLSCSMVSVLKERAQVSVLTAHANETEEFREQDLPAELFWEIQATGLSLEKRMELLTDTMLAGNYHPEQLVWEGGMFQKYKRMEYLELLESYQAIWQDVKCFPVFGKEADFSDGWMDVRSYGGERVHEGTDLFGPSQIPGDCPVVSMTDGIVEQVGWLTLGGYRIGIRSPLGGYFYYAHLDSYDREFQPGDFVSAGEILGFMGNTGYGTEGTRGKFPVHLHVGIYIRTSTEEELSVNPYQVLRALQGK